MGKGPDDRLEDLASADFRVRARAAEKLKRSGAKLPDEAARRVDETLEAEIDQELESARGMDDEHGGWTYTAGPIDRAAEVAGWFGRFHPLQCRTVARIARDWLGYCEDKGHPGSLSASAIVNAFVERLGRENPPARVPLAEIAPSLTELAETCRQRHRGDWADTILRRLAEIERSRPTPPAAR